MTGQETTFLMCLAANTAIVIVYLLVQIIYKLIKRKKGKEFLMHGLIMFLCPVVGPLFFLCVNIIYLCIRQSADLDDVIFSKERVFTYTKADEEVEGNMVPLEEALLVSDKQSLRTLMMNVIKGGVQGSLASVSLALNSEETETAHYAASVLQEALNDFRQKVQNLYEYMKEQEESKCDYASMMIETMPGILLQNVFDEMEQQTYVLMLEEAASILYDNDREMLKERYMEWTINCLIGSKMYDLAEQWCERAVELYPRELFTYTCRLKLYFNRQDNERFFEVLDQLKKSDVVIDRETLELIRAFDN